MSLRPQAVPGRLNIPDFDEAPLLVLWEITRACELACTHCRAEAQPRPDPRELNHDEAGQLLEEIAGMGTPLVVLTGGDPLQRGDLLDLIRRGVDLGLRMTLTPSVTSRLTPPVLHDLKEAGLCRLALSLDAGDAEVHDRMRGYPGVFDHTVDLLMQAHALGLSTQVNTTVTRSTRSTLAGLPPILEAAGVDLWSVFFLVPTGRAEASEVPSPQECEETFDFLYQVARQAPYAVKATEAPSYRRFALRQRDQGGRPPMAGVNDGKGVVFVSHRGEVYPSGFLPVSCGNVRQTPLAEIYQGAPMLRALRDPERLLGKCGHCEYRKLCGGSRARAYAMTGSPLAADPACAYRPHIRRSLDRGPLRPRA